MDLVAFPHRTHLFKVSTLLGFSHSGLVEIFGGKFGYISFFKCLYLYLWFVFELST